MKFEKQSLIIGILVGVIIGVGIGFFVKVNKPQPLKSKAERLGPCELQTRAYDNLVSWGRASQDQLDQFKGMMDSACGYNQPDNESDSWYLQQ